MVTSAVPGEPSSSPSLGVTFTCQISPLAVLSDGTVEEVDLESWYEQDIIPIEPPEDWSGSLDLEKEDYGVDLEETSHVHWENPLDTYDEQD